MNLPEFHQIFIVKIVIKIENRVINHNLEFDFKKIILN